MPESLNTSEPNGFRWYYTTSNQDLPQGQPPVSGTQQGFMILGSNTRIGFQNPRWKDQCRLGTNATTNFVGTEFSGDTDRSYWEAYAHGSFYSVAAKVVYSNPQRTGGGFLPYASLPSTGGPPTSVVNDVHNRCIMKFINEVIAAQSSENLTGRSIKHFKHDIHSTLHPMAGIQKKISSYLTNLEKVSYGKLKGPSLYSTITSAYLEFKFGVEPFVDDITAIVSDMVIRDRKRNPSVSVEGTASASYNGSVTTTNFGNSFFSSFIPTQYIRKTSKYTERIKGAVRTGINDDGRLGFLADNRLLPSDWLPTAFSILPYAWMVNYFTNVRDIIDAASFRFSDLVWGCATSRVINTIEYSNVFFLNGTFGPPPAGATLVESIYTSGGNATFNYKQTSRSALSPGQLVPSFEFRIPMTPTPWLNMMAAFSPRILKVVSKLF